MLRIAVLVSGGGTNLQAVMDAIADGRIPESEIVLVLSNRKDAYALTRAKEAGIPSAVVSAKEYPDRERFAEALFAETKKASPDLIVLAGFLATVPEEMVRHFEGKILNVHPSLIPSFCGKGFYGLKVHEAALERGVKVTGATVHLVDEDLDTGPILKQKAVAVQPGDTPEILQRRVMEEAEWIILPEAIAEIAEKQVRI
ncbi:MAG: phosphoribosylglycinamide formyltransferase [Lachnospiraceae bacterium]|nr:phosphoribosylglycinamide formyltransferase [Lachnospiraceae bacterium]